MLLMGLMSVILFFGGLLTSNDRPVPIVDNLPNEGLLRPTSLLPWESVELSETRLLFRHEEMQEVKSPQRKIRNGGQHAREELEALRKMEDEQLACFDDDIRYMTQAVDTLTAGLKTAKEVLDF